MVRGATHTTADLSAIPRKLGRPRATRAVDTRRMILDVARGVYADLGYNVATNKDIADAASMTTAAIYYYFESKKDLYLAVFDDVQVQVYERLDKVIAGLDTFADQIRAVLESAHQMNDEDPTLARFLGTFRVDVRRNPELQAEAAPGLSSRARFFTELIELGVRNGEVDAEDRDRVLAVVLTVIAGLVDAMSDDQEQHAAAVAGFSALLDGTLVRRVGSRLP